MRGIHVVLVFCHTRHTVYFLLATLEIMGDVSCSVVCRDLVLHLLGAPRAAAKKLGMVESTFAAGCSHT